ncbi:MAG: RteC domain-containing protein [Taibaiella sp.]|nr:RteC domain-containing protein [Taibaiella sp.]
MADIRQIISALEGIFKIQLGDFYRVFLNIRIRQSSRTTFMDELKEKLIERMDETDLNGR